MPFTAQEQAQIRAFGKLVFTNPFTAERVEIERELLGRRHLRLYPVWHSLGGLLSVNPNLPPIMELSRQLLEKGLSEWPPDSELTPDYLESWDLLSIYCLFAKYSDEMTAILYRPCDPEKETARLYPAFLGDFRRCLAEVRRPVPSPYKPEAIFALFYQVHRAFNHIFDFIAGGTAAAAGLRSAIWESLFTYDMGMYYRHLTGRMNEFTTLITGESGTGKELVARALAFSQFIPFDAGERRFVSSYRDCFSPVQLSAIPQPLIESELFGHVKGAFTGAVADHAGHLEACLPCGSIFLDEIGDIAPEIQLKLLRLLQTKTFQRIGSTSLLPFRGKIIAATNMDLEKACESGRFRHDLLFRLCSDTIRTAPLRQLIDGQESELRKFVLVLAKRMLDSATAESFADRCCQWIVTHLGMDYPWPGNVRELGQCLRNLLVHGDYKPMSPPVQPSGGGLEAELLSSGLTAEALLRLYVTAVHRREGSALATARVVGLDRRTVKKYLA